MSASSSWHDNINDRRKGAGYFLLQTGHPCFEPIAYIKHRALKRHQSSALIDEWTRWMLDFKKSSYEAVRRAAVAAAAITQDDIDEYYRDRISVDREQDALESSRIQLRVADQLHTSHMEKRLAESTHVSSSQVSKTCKCPDEQTAMSEEDTPLEQPETVLGKRDRDRDDHDKDVQQPTASKGEHVVEDSNVKRRVINLDNPCRSEGAHDDDNEDETEEDSVTLVMEQSHHPLNVVFDSEAFNFSCILGQYDISEPFNDYYEEAFTLPYDHTSFPDFLAIGGILFLGEEPTQIQRQKFGEHYEKLREAMLATVKPDNNNVPAMADEEDATVTFCQAARSVFRKAERQGGPSFARKQLKKRIEEEEDSPLKELYEHAVKLPKECAPVSEADQTSSFILGMLRPIFDRPDFSRLAHTATTATSGSIFVRLCKNMSTLSKNPDLLVRYKECLDIGVAEVSFESSAPKDTGDLCRTALWSKRLLDQIVTKFENIEQVQLIFFHVVEQTCTFYIMRRADTVCVAVEFARLKIAYNISDVLTNFEDDARDWLLICRTFDNLVTMLQSAKLRKSEHPPPAVFAGLCTPRSRYMKEDTRRDKYGRKSQA
ncbi:hypothetical protein EC991_010939 [Linnemannia zychae]|nr:hypothetical protein EC991_010939 [Linnemannia zychae]